MDLNSVSVHKQPKKQEVGQYLAIFISWPVTEEFTTLCLAGGMIVGFWIERSGHEP